MSFTEALPPRAKQDGTGISFSLRELRSGLQARVTMTEAAQKHIFGDVVVGRKAKALIGRDQDEGKLRIVLADDGFLEFTASIRGSVSLSIRAWDLLPGSPRKAEAAAVVEGGGGDAVTLRLPSWAKPNGAGGKVEEAAPTRPAARKPEPGEMVGKKAVSLADAGEAMKKAVGR